MREQYGKQIGAYQAIAHLLTESLALIEGSVSVLRNAAWGVDELEPAQAIQAAQIAKVYCARATRTVCETRSTAASATPGSASRMSTCVAP